MRTKLRSWAAWAAGATGALALIVTAAACGSSVDASASLAPSPSASVSVSISPNPSMDVSAAVASVQANWERFFSDATSAAQRADLLQRGQEYAQTLRSKATTTVLSGITAQVKSVDVTSPDTANVTYDIVRNGQTLLSNVQGQAVLENGTWKISTQSFQGVLDSLQSQLLQPSSP